jgi:hypothetical protein
MNHVAYLFVMFFAAVIFALTCADTMLDIFDLDPTMVRDDAIFGAAVISAAMAASALAKRLIG